MPDAHRFTDTNSIDQKEPHKNEAKWEAGLARVDITPPLGLWLAGFGGRTHGAEGVHDPLYATALVLAAEGKRVAVVSCDLLSIDAPDVAHLRREIEKSTGIASADILIHATHTHSGPLTCAMRGFGHRDPHYESVLFRQIVTAVALADQRLQPVELTYGTTDAEIAVNRRERQGDSIVIGENPEGPVDSRVASVGIWPAGIQSAPPIGILFWTAVHPVLFGAGNYRYGRDFPGFAVDRLERAFPDAICLYLTGPCGDINPLGMKSEDRFATAERHGEAAAAAVMAAIRSGRSIPAQAPRSFHRTIKVPQLPLPPEEELLRIREAARTRILARGGEAMPIRLEIDAELRWAEDALASLRGEAGAPHPVPNYEAELHALILGDFVLTGLPFEVFVSYQKVAEVALDGMETLIVGYANGNYGYLPTKEAFPEGGYEVDRAFHLYSLQQLSPEAPDAVVQGIEELLGDLA